MVETEIYNAAVEGGLDYKEMLGDAVILMGENGGYTYVAIDTTDGISYNNEAIREKIVTAALRARELLENATFIDIVLPPEEQKGTAKDLRQLQAVGYGEGIPVGHQQAKLSVGLGDGLRRAGNDPQVGQLGLQQTNQAAVGAEDQDGCDLARGMWGAPGFPGQ